MNKGYSFLCWLFLAGVLFTAVMFSALVGCSKHDLNQKRIEERAEQNWQDALTCCIESGEPNGVCADCMLAHGFPYDILLVQVTMEDKINALLTK